MDLLQQFRKIDEAYRVRHGLPVDRQFSDDELAPSQEGLDHAERELFGETLIPFAAKVTFPGQAPVRLNILATHSCDAITRALEIACPDFDTVKPKGRIDIQVTPLRAQEAEPCAA